MLNSRRALALLPAALSLIVAGEIVVHAAAQVESVSYANPAQLPKDAGSPAYRLSHDLFRDDRCVFQHVEFRPKVHVPPRRQNGLWFAMHLDAGLLVPDHPVAPVPVHAGSVMTTPKAGMILDGFRVDSPAPHSVLNLRCPPAAEDQASEADAAAVAEKNRKKGGSKSPVDVYELIKPITLADSSKPAVSTTAIKPSDLPGIEVKAFVVGKAVTLVSSTDETFWIPLEGQANLSWGGKTLKTRPKTVIRVSHKTAVRVTPEGKRFSMLAVTLLEK